MNHAIGCNAHAQRPPAGGGDLGAAEIAATTVAADSQVRVIMFLAGLLLVLEFDEHPGPVDFVAHFTFGAFKDADANFLVDHRRGFQGEPEAKVGAAAVFPFVNRREKDARGHAGDFGNLDRPFEAVLNIGDEVMLFEATHGTAPKYTDLDVVNPGSLMFSGVMMLEFMGWWEAARLVEQGYTKALEQKIVTYDFARQMEGATKVKTSEFATAVINNMG